MIHTVLLSSAEPNAYIKHTLNLKIFPQYRSFLRSYFYHGRTLNCGKWRVKKNTLAPVALTLQNMLVYGARNSSVSLVLSSRMMKLSRAGKQALHTHIVSNVFEKLWKSTKRSNVMIQINPAKIEVHRSKKNGL